MPHQNLQQNKTIVRTSPYKNKHKRIYQISRDNTRVDSIDLTKIPVCLYGLKALYRNTEIQSAHEIIIEACYDKTNKISEDSDQYGHLMVSKKKNPLFV